MSTQYYQTDSSGNQQYVSNDPDVLAGIWVDDTNDITSIKNSLSTNLAGPTNTYTMLAEEASRAAAHFGVTGAALADANFIIAQPPAYTDPNAINSGYCAFHDYTLAASPGNSYYNYPGVEQGIQYTNEPYQLAINSGSTNECGEYAVNNNQSDTDPMTSGKLDGFSITLGHEIEETITDPGAEDITGSGVNGETYYGGWYDAADANENGDKCAWVGENLATAQGPPEPIYGALGDITGNAGETFAVQSLWSNAADEGTGYCAGANTDSPVPSAAYGSSGSSSSSSSSSASPSTTSETSSGIRATATSQAKPKAKKATAHKKRKRRVRKHRKRRRRKHKK